MNHGPAFQKLNTQIRTDCKEEQKKGYYGDGFYSSGIHLESSIVVQGGVIAAGDAPEYICGGAANRQAPNKKARTGRGAGGRKRGLQADGQASTSSGAQTAKKRKAGSSNTRVFEGREDAVRIDGAPEITKDELKRVKALVNERKAAFRASLGLTIKAATEKAMQSLTPAERRVIETSTHGKRARDIRAAHFERLLATKTEQDKPVLGEEDTKPTSTKAEETADDTSDASDSVAGGEDEGGLDEYAQDFLGEMDEEEKRVAKGDDTQTTASQFGKSMIDDEKRRARADLLGLNAGGRSIGASSSQHKSRSPSRDVKQRGRSEDDDVIVIQD
ncbi:hypothetical protein QFC24_005313 [Naganishia onofrii]|uniref:Uncharacterized protein n=1 Tax=Naganishia onofrii TaxID=1851511 RepID=A0ACC2XAM9_9TREE|nr:hypothetical protein QFC24_005313 [Naganishia onofrii]